MLVVISPAKRLDWLVRAGAMTRPEFQEEAEALVRVARRKSVDELRRLMGLSESLARLNHARYRRFSEPGDPRPAVLGFAGDTYLGLEAASLDPHEMEYAEAHLRILSGLYGLLRPRDAIEEHRLEMGTRLKTRRGASLYDWWGDKIADALNRQAEEVGAGVIVNCASVEYFTAARADLLRPKVITPQFLEDKPGGPKVVSFWAKKARGAMARFIIQNRLTDPAALTGFDMGGYVHAPELSEADRPAFLRPALAAA